MADCLSNAVVLRIILQHFSNTELLELSFVNKFWNYEARSLMRNRGDLKARLQFIDNQPCQEYLDAFAADLRRMNVVPFSGIQIKLGHCSRACKARALDSTYSTIIDQLPLKSISVVLAEKWSKNKVCPGCVLITAILQHFSAVLEKVSVGLKRSQQDILAVRFVRDRSFPNLKILKLGESYDRFDETYVTSMLSAVVARAPKLQELHTEGPIDLILNVLKGTSAVLVLQSYIAAPFDEIPHTAINRIRLQKLRLRYTGPDFNLERLNRITPILLQSPCTATLPSVDVDAFLAVPLMCYGIRLENVKSFTMKINFSHMERVEPRILGILKNFDFTHIFPNLEEVSISLPIDDPELSADHMSGLVEQANLCLNVPELDRAVNIRELDLSTGISAANAEFYAAMFPQIEELRVREEFGDVSFGSIWKNWVNLKFLYAFTDVQKHYDDLESVICGIFPEEVAELRQKDEEFLKKVNIVPVMPAVTCLKNLRMLSLILAPFSDPTHGYRSLGYVEPPPQLILSKVTGLVAFARRPELFVVLSTYVPHIYEGVRQMEPYATIHFASGY